MANVTCKHNVKIVLSNERVDFCPKCGARKSWKTQIWVARAVSSTPKITKTVPTPSMLTEDTESAHLARYHAQVDAGLLPY